MSRLRARLDRLDRLTRPRVRAPVTEDERRRRWIAANPDGAAGARDRLAERVARLTEAAEAGNTEAAAQLDRLRAHLRDLTEGRTP